MSEPILTAQPSPHESRTARRPLTERSPQQLGNPFRVFMPPCALAVGVVMGLLLVACGRSSEPTDTNTQWLTSCESDDECGAGFSCLCNLCTVSCTATATCSKLSEAAICAPSNSGCGERICARDLDVVDSTDASVPASTAPDAPTTGDLDGGSTGHDPDSSDTPDAGMRHPDAVASTPLICDLWGSSLEPVLEVCEQDQVCCTCGCGADGAGCSNEAACPPRGGVTCGTAECAGSQLCCSAERNLCAADAAACDAALADFDLPGAGSVEGVELSAQLVEGSGCCDFYGVVWRDLVQDFCVYAEFRQEVGNDGVLSAAVAAQPASACSLLARVGIEGGIEAESAHGFVVVNPQLGSVPLLDTWFTMTFASGSLGIPSGLRVAHEALVADGTPQ